MQAILQLREDRKALQERIEELQGELESVRRGY